MERQLNPRIQSFLAAEEPRRPLFSAPAPTTQPPSRTLTRQRQNRPLPPNPPSKSLSDASTVSSTTSDQRSDTSWGRQSSVSSATSINVGPWKRLLPTLVQQIAMLPFNYGYDLPCEFFFAGCNVRFHPTQFEEWISHTASHFRSSLPKIAICTFCDNDAAIFHSDGDDMMNWRNRMIHVAAHLEDLTPSEHIRPDFWVVEHMWNHGLISEEDYADALKGTERPYCANTYPLDYETPAMVEKKQRQARASYDMRGEERHRRRGTRTGRESRAHRNPNINHSQGEVVRGR